jgi:hypothetical protein
MVPWPLVSRGIMQTRITGSLFSVMKPASTPRVGNPFFSSRSEKPEDHLSGSEIC